MDDQVVGASPRHHCELPGGVDGMWPRPRRRGHVGRIRKGQIRHTSVGRAVAETNDPSHRNDDVGVKRTERRRLDDDVEGAHTT